jgi:hypothetical protein
MTKTTITLLILSFFVVFISASNEKRKIELLPSVKSPKSFERKVIEVSREFIEKHLVGKEEFTFIDITDEKNTPTPTIAEPDYPAIRRQSIVKPILEKASAASTKDFMAKLTSFSSRRSSAQVSQQSILMIKSELEKIISGLSEERKKRFKIELVPIR